MYHQINQINILSVLDKLGIKYKDLGNRTSGILEDGKITNGWRVNSRDNYVHDFSGKGRSQGPPFLFLRQYLNLTNHQTFQRFVQNFNIENNKQYRNRGSPGSIKQKKNRFAPYSRKRLTE